MKKMIFGWLLFIGGLLGLLLFPLTAAQGPWMLNGDILSVSMVTFTLGLIVGFVICVYTNSLTFPLSKLFAFY